MEMLNRQKCKKRKTSRQLDEIRKRSTRNLKNIVFQTKDNTLKLNENVHKKKHSEQITSKRLTLSLFNKTVRSKTVTRFPLEQNNVINNYNDKGKDWDNILSSNRRTDKTKSSNYTITCDNKDFTYNTHIPIPSDMGLEINNTPDSVILFSPMSNEREESVPQSPIINNNKHMYLSVSSSSCSNSESETTDCLYQNFMNGLPTYLRKQFPMLTKDTATIKNVPNSQKNFENRLTIRKKIVQPVYNTDNMQIKNVPNFQQNLEHCLIRKKIVQPVYNTDNMQSLNYGDSIIQNPMNYIAKGLSWDGSVKKKNYILSSNSSSTSSQLEENVNIYNSPEYIYFPHKLNQ